MKRKRFDWFDVAVTVASAAVCLYYLVFLLLCFAGFDSKIMCVIAVLIIAAVGLPVLLHRKIADCLGKAYKPLRIIFGVAVCVFALLQIVFWLSLNFIPHGSGDSYAASAEDHSGENTCVLVFGCRTYGMRPGSTLRLRLEEAKKILDAMPDAVCIVSGGQGSNETVAEAVAMKAWLVEAGIDESRIYSEDKSHSTSENIRFSKEIMAEFDSFPDRIIAVSSYFHMPRIGILSEVYGLDVELCESPMEDFGLNYVSVVREFFAYVKMIFVDVFPSL